MNNNETIQNIMEGGEHLYTMLKELCEGIGNLPNCKMTAGLKELAEDVDVLGFGVYETMRGFASDADTDCADCPEAEYSDNTDDPEADIPANTDLEDFLGAVANLLTSGKPFTVSADIYLNSPEAENNGDA